MPTDLDQLQNVILDKIDKRRLACRAAGDKGGQETCIALRTFVTDAFAEHQAGEAGLREAVRKFLFSAGHELCHENRRELALAAGIELPGIEAWPMLPPESEFDRRCQVYRKELYGPDQPTPSNAAGGEQPK